MGTPMRTCFGWRATGARPSLVRTPIPRRRRLPLEALEARCLLTVTAVPDALPDLTRPQDSPAELIDLTEAFTGVDTFVRLNLSIGESLERTVDVQLFND